MRPAGLPAPLQHRAPAVSPTIASCHSPRSVTHPCIVSTLCPPSSITPSRSCRLQELEDQYRREREEATYLLEQQRLVRVAPPGGPQGWVGGARVPVFPAGPSAAQSHCCGGTLGLTTRQPRQEGRAGAWCPVGTTVPASVPGL